MAILFQDVFQSGWILPGSVNGSAQNWISVPPRTGGNIASIGGSLYWFGGRNTTDGVMANDLWRFSVGAALSGTNRPGWNNVISSGTPGSPPPRMVGCDIVVHFAATYRLVDACRELRLMFLQTT
jgi:hypothetical protein